MHAQEEDIAAHALRKLGWSITVIANDHDPDRKTIRATATATADGIGVAIRARAHVRALETATVPPTLPHVTV